MEKYKIYKRALTFGVAVTLLFLFQTKYVLVTGLHMWCGRHNLQYNFRSLKYVDVKQQFNSYQRHANKIKTKKLDL